LSSVAIPIFAVVLAVAFWQLAPWLARVLLGQRDASVSLAGLCLEDLYRFAFVFLGLYFALSSLAPTITWAHYNFLVAAKSVAPYVGERRSLYYLLEPAITFAAGLTCMLKGSLWASKLAQRDKTVAPGTTPKVDAAGAPPASAG